MTYINVQAKQNAKNIINQVKNDSSVVKRKLLDQRNRVDELVNEDKSLSSQSSSQNSANKNLESRNSGAESKLISEQNEVSKLNSFIFHEKDNIDTISSMLGNYEEFTGD
jgi:predicted nuclease with TOPRIM domain